MARRVHQVELIGVAVRVVIIQPYGLRLDRDATLTLNVHVVEQLFFHVALGNHAAMLDEPVSQRRLAMINVRDDREIANF